MATIRLTSSALPAVTPSSPSAWSQRQGEFFEGSLSASSGHGHARSDFPGDADTHRALDKEGAPVLGRGSPASLTPCPRPTDLTHLLARQVLGHEATCPPLPVSSHSDSGVPSVPVTKLQILSLGTPWLAQGKPHLPAQDHVGFPKHSGSVRASLDGKSSPFVQGFQKDRRSQGGSPTRRNAASLGGTQRI